MAVLFAADEQRPHGAPAVIVSYGYWQRYLGSATDLSKFHVDIEGSVLLRGRCHAGGI